MAGRSDVGRARLRVVSCRFRARRLRSGGGVAVDAVSSIPTLGGEPTNLHETLYDRVVHVDAIERGTDASGVRHARCPNRGGTPPRRCVTGSVRRDHRARVDSGHCEGLRDGRGPDPRPRDQFGCASDPRRWYPDHGRTRTRSGSGVRVDRSPRTGRISAVDWLSDATIQWSGKRTRKWVS